MCVRSQNGVVGGCRSCHNIRLENVICVDLKTNNKKWPLPWLSPKIPRKRGTISGVMFFSQWSCDAVPNSQSFDPLTCAKLTCTKLPSNWQHLHPFPLLPRDHIPLLQVTSVCASAL